MLDVALDLDGTISEENIGDYYDKGITDVDELRNIISGFHPKKGVELLNEYGIKPIIITGRREFLRDATEVWLYKQGIPYKELVMMPENYYPTGKIDWDLYNKYKVDEHKKRPIRFAMDDKLYTVAILNSCGIRTYLVKEDFGEILEEAISDSM